MKRFAALMTALLFSLTFVCGSVLAEPFAPETRGQAGRDVSGFAAECIDGGSVTGAAFAEYSLCIVTYWAVWSADALRQLDYLAQVHAQRPDIGVFGLLYTDSTSTPTAALQYMQAHGYTFPVFTADTVWEGVASQSAYIPQSFIVSPGGVILEAYHGAFSSASQMLSEAQQWIGPAGTYTVRFFDRIRGNCTLLASYTGLSYGASVSAPAVPEHAGYVFTGWSTYGYTNVTGNIDVFTVYSSNLPDGDVDASGTADAQDALMLLRVVMGLVNSTPAVIQHGDMDLNGSITANDVLLLLRALLFGDI